jgi:transcriptional regulator GlxA family with amidase domain
MHRVVALTFARLEAFDLSSVAEVFTSAPVADRYAFAIASASAGPVTTTHGYRLSPPASARAIDRADTLVVPGFTGAPDTRGLAAIRHAHQRGARLISVCTGAFALAEAGVLDGRAATTHWLRTDELAARFPAVDVRPDVLFVDSGDVLTSAGTAAGLDLCLHVVRRDLGADVANDVARRLVAAPYRDGGQAQYVERPVPASTGRLADTRAWVLQRLDCEVDVSAMARHANLSPRHFVRLFTAETGTTPHRWVTTQRVLHARRLLETTDLSIDEVATLSGFNTAAALRAHFRDELRTSPNAYRRSFRGDERHATLRTGSAGA